MTASRRKQKGGGGISDGKISIAISSLLKIVPVFILGFLSVFIIQGCQRTPSFPVSKKVMVVNSADLSRYIVVSEGEWETKEGALMDAKLGAIWKTLWDIAKSEEEKRKIKEVEESLYLNPDAFIEKFSVLDEKVLKTEKGEKYWVKLSVSVMRDKLVELIREKHGKAEKKTRKMALPSFEDPPDVAVFWKFEAIGKIGELKKVVRRTLKELGFDPKENTDIREVDEELKKFPDRVLDELSLINIGDEDKLSLLIGADFSLVFSVSGEDDEFEVDFSAHEPITSFVVGNVNFEVDLSDDDDVEEMRKKIAFLCEKMYALWHAAWKKKKKFLVVLSSSHAFSDHDQFSTREIRKIADREGKNGRRSIFLTFESETSTPEETSFVLMDILGSMGLFATTEHTFGRVIILRVNQ